MKNNHKSAGYVFSLHISNFKELVLETQIFMKSLFNSFINTKYRLLINLTKTYLKSQELYKKNQKPKIFQ